MKIKEMEERSGMTRANIRFYESEGLLSPEREINGYREYSEEDLQVLMRIKLLRSLHITLEEIKELHNGSLELSAALDLHLTRLEAEKEDLEHSQEICQAMRRDGVSYQSLNAQHYLNDLQKKAPVAAKASPEYEDDVIPRVRSPWRRFFARNIDLTIYSVLWSMLLTLALNVNISSRGTAGKNVDLLMAVVFMLILEPAMLSLFGTTPGKFLLGLRITSCEGRRLTYSEAASRTVSALWYGMGFCIPIYNLVRLWKSYKDCSEGYPLRWEGESTMSLKDEKAWRIGAVVCTYAFLFGVLVLTIMSSGLPKHRGEISVAEFCDNYNRLAKYYDVGTDRYYLDESGKWIEVKNYGEVVIEIGGGVRTEYIFTEQDGVMTGVEFAVEMTNSDDWPSSYQNEMILLMLSFIQAQKEYNSWRDGSSKIIEKVQQSEFRDFSFTEYGITVTCDVDYSGYMETADMGMLFPEEGQDNSFQFRFSMKKNAGK